MTNESSSMTMKSDNESKLVNTTSSSSSSGSNVNNNNIYNNCNNSSNKSVTVSVTTVATVSSIGAQTTTAAVTTSDLLPSITLAPFAKIKRESDFGGHTVRQTQLSSSSSASTSSSMVTKSISSNSQVPAVASNSVSAKMGSRRIFTPQFKLQVLESYRNDSDCKGNQRATARKYNIHRRQIQKWLQCESNLRSSVANISANNVKHQFHNISHQMPIVTTSTLPSSASSSIHTNNNHHAHHNHQQYKAINNRLSLDTTRHSVALTSIPTIPTSKATQGVLAAAAAAANVGDVGAVVPLSSSSPASASYLSTTVKSLHAPTSPILHPQILTKSTVSPSALQCAKGGPVVIGGSSIPPQSMLHTPYHLHDSVGIHTPPALLTSVPVPVSIITPHPHTHLHVANLKNHYHHLHMESQHHQQQQQQQHHHHHHHHHHHPYNQMAQPPPPPQSSQQSSERRPFMPSASLPVLPTSSSSSSSSSSTTASSPPAPMPAVALSCTDTSATTPGAALSLAQAEENRIDELRDYQTTTALLEENRYMNENEYVHSRTQLHSAFEGFPYYMPLHMHPAAAAAAMIAPIDLSLGTKRIGYALSFSENNNEFKRDRSADKQHSTTYESATPKRETSSPKENEQDDDNEESHLNVVDSDFSESSSVVDLTLRKRKVIMPTATEPETVSAEKQTKLSCDDVDEKETEKPQEPAKTFKLFKPYLLDDDNKSTDGDKESASKICKQKEPIIWSHHTACLSPPISHESRQCSSRGSNFQSPSADAAYPFPAGSPNFQPNNTTVTAASFRCPKGSPVSGYESSSSIYSDSASSASGDHHYTNAPPATYSFDLKVHNIHGDLPAKHLISTATNRPFIGDGCIPLPPATINHVQRWLDQESGIRQSIALYV